MKRTQRHQAGRALEKKAHRTARGSIAAACAVLLPGLALAVSACGTTRLPDDGPAPGSGAVGEERATSEAPSRAGFPTMPPSLGDPPDVSLPSPVSRTLENGLDVMYVPHGELPFVHVTLLLMSGRASDPLELAGLAGFVADMLDEGAGGRDALVLADEIELLGASISAAAGWDDSRVHLQVLRPRLGEALWLMADVALRPDFPEQEVERVRNELLSELARVQDEPTHVASTAFTSLSFGDGHAYGRTRSSESVRRYSREDLVRFHDLYYRPGNAVLILSGDVDAEADHPAVEAAFGAWAHGPVRQAAPPPAPPTDRRTIYLIHRPDAPQSVLRIGHAGVSRDHPDYYAIVVLDAVLGASFTSRLMTRLRTELGYAYTARSTFDMRRGPGPFIASASVVTERTDSALVEFFREFDRIRHEPVPEDELQRAKQYVAFGLPHDFETATQVANRMASVTLYGLGADYYDTYVDRIMAVTAEDVQRAAQEHLRPEAAVVVVVGDREEVEDRLRAVGLGDVSVHERADFVR